MLKKLLLCSLFVSFSLSAVAQVFLNQDLYCKGYDNAGKFIVRDEDSVTVMPDRYDYHHTAFDLSAKDLLSVTDDKISFQKILKDTSIDEREIMTYISKEDHELSGNTRVYHFDIYRDHLAMGFAEARFTLKNGKKKVELIRKIGTIKCDFGTRYTATAMKILKNKFAH